MLVKIGAKAFQIMFDEKGVKELRRLNLHGHIPGQCNGKKQKESQPPDSAQKDFLVAPQDRVSAYNQYRQYRSNRAFGQYAQR